MKRIHFTNVFLTTFLLILGLSAFAQRPLNGVVKDAEGLTLPGANVVVTGTLTGVTSDLDGKFFIELPSGSNEIEVSFVGYVTKKLNVEGKNFIEVILLPEALQLQEMVVTALGIKRESKALGYSVQQVDGEALSNTSRISPISGLMGQVAGLQIGESGSGAGGSQKILIRGANSLTGSNDPLFVVDGVPIDNSGGSSGGLFGGFDYGNAANNINADDIESVTVLKGGAASALYGARGQNGVIMITTKSGSRKEGIGITYQTMFSFQDPLIKPDFQTNFSQGSGGKFGKLNPRSWGEKMQGQSVVNFLGQEQILNTVTENPYDAFFRTAISQDHSVTLDKKGETNGILFSASWNQNDGIIRTNEFDKNPLTYATTRNLQNSSHLMQG
jgi:TonB-dependent SusC/RagA subfamily outer membrane receptor